MHACVHVSLFIFKVLSKTGVLLYLKWSEPISHCQMSLSVVEWMFFGRLGSDQDGLIMGLGWPD